MDLNIKKRIKKQFRKSNLKKSSQKIIPSRYLRLKQISSNARARVEKHQYKFVNEKMSLLLEKKKPFKITNVPQFYDKNSYVAENFVDRLLEICEIKKVDVSISQTNRFSGNYGQNKVISMALSEFLNYQGPNTIYIAQMPLFEKNQSPKIKAKTQNKTKLHKILNELGNMNSFCSTLFNKIERINLWYSKKETFSQLHYDSYDNFLFMIKGTKVITVFRPNDPSITCESIITNTYQQAKQITNEKQNLFSFRITINEGEGIFLPQGWFHQVESYGEGSIIALNLWFNPITDICQGREKYLLRYLLFQETEKEINELLELYTQKNKDRKLQKSLLKDQENYAIHIRFLIENVSSNLELSKKYFSSVICSIQNRSLRKFIQLLVLEDSSKAEYLFLNLDDWTIEYFTNTLEKLDASENYNESAERDIFYNILFENLDFSSIQNYFISSKKLLKKKGLEFLIKHKISESYAF